MDGGPILVGPPALHSTLSEILHGPGRLASGHELKRPGRIGSRDRRVAGHEVHLQRARSIAIQRPAEAERSVFQGGNGQVAPEGWAGRTEPDELDDAPDDGP